MKISILTLLVLISANVISQNLSEEQSASVTKFTALVKNQDWVGLSKSMTYPLKRQYPVTPIENATEFIERKSELFDDYLISLITNASVQNDWSSIDSRGITLKNGKVWLDVDGNVIEINYQTAVEKTLEAQLIKADKDSIHESLKEFKRPILKMKTEVFLIRIDELENESFRFAGWITGTNNGDDKPLELIQNGILEREETGGNLSYSFTSSFGTFVCVINKLAKENTPEAELLIYRDDILLRSCPSMWLKN